MSYHSATCMTSFKIVDDRDPPPIVPFVCGETRLRDLEAQLLTCDEMLVILKQNLLKAHASN